jgi:hypothetical protein
MHGTLTTYDLIASRFQYPNTRLSEIGEEDVYKSIQMLLADHEFIMRGYFADLAEYTTERDALYGGGETGVMTEVDEMGTAPPTKVTAGSVVGFPLKRFEKSWQGSKKYLAKATLGEMLAQVNYIRSADKLTMLREAKLALFNPVNYTADDYLGDHRTQPIIAVKRLINADSMPIPPGPNGEIFPAATHTHYLGTASFVAADLVALKETVLEHFGSGDFVIAIARAQEAAIRLMTPNFVYTLPGSQVGPTTVIQLPGTKFPITPTGRRQIGEFDGIPVEVKPWVPSNYIVCYNRSVKPLAIRVEGGVAGAGELTIDADDENHPLRAETYSREFGVGIRQRHAAAVLFTGNATYSSPTL